MFRRDQERDEDAQRGFQGVQPVAPSRGAKFPAAQGAHPGLDCCLRSTAIGRYECSEPARLGSLGLSLQALQMVSLPVGGGPVPSARVPAINPAEVAVWSRRGEGGWSGQCDNAAKRTSGAMAAVVVAASLSTGRRRSCAGHVCG